MSLPVLGRYMAMSGLDLHTAITLEAPIPFLAPHNCTAALTWLAESTRRTAETVMTPEGPLVLRGHDIGPAIPHFSVMAPTNVCLLAITLGSSSKSQFGAGSVRATGGYPVAVAVLDPIAIQQQCGDSVPGVSSQIGVGFVVAFGNSSVRAGFTWGDLVGSLLAMYADTVLTSLISLGLGAILSKGEQIAQGVWELLRPLVNTIVGWHVGGPTGYSLPWNPFQLIAPLVPDGDSVFDIGKHMVDGIT